MTTLLFTGIIALVVLIGLADCGKPYCRYGSYGTCSSTNKYACVSGAYCNRPPYSSLGLCCRRKPVISGICPPSSGFGICVFDPLRNCLNHSVCPPDYLCCSEGCGKVCKHYKTGKVYTGKLTFNTM